jgi:hypothetical protein
MKIVNKDKQMKIILKGWTQGICPSLEDKTRIFRIIIVTLQIHYLNELQQNAFQVCIQGMKILGGNSNILKITNSIFAEKKCNRVLVGSRYLTQWRFMRETIISETGTHKATHKVIVDPDLLTQE